MMDRFLLYVKDSKGSIIPVAALYDSDGNEIPKTYLKKDDAGSIRVYYDADGYPCYDDRTKE